MSDNQEHCFCGSMDNPQCDHYRPPNILSREDKVKRLAEQGRDEHGISRNAENDDVSVHDS